MSINTEIFSKEEIKKWADKSFPENIEFLGLIENEINDANAIRDLLKEIDDINDLMTKLKLTELQAFQFRSHFKSLLGLQQIKEQKKIMKIQFKQIQSLCNFKNAEKNLEKMRE